MSLVFLLCVSVDPTLAQRKNPENARGVESQVVSPGLGPALVVSVGSYAAVAASADTFPSTSSRLDGGLCSGELSADVGLFPVGVVGIPPRLWCSFLMCTSLYLSDVCIHAGWIECAERVRAADGGAACGRPVAACVAWQLGAIYLARWELRGRLAWS